VAAQQQPFCFYTETAHFYLRQPRRALSFAYRGQGHSINIQFSNPASRSAPMPAAFSMAIAPNKNDPNAEGRAKTVLEAMPGAPGTVHKIANP
jgi:hypothetical protein